MKYSIYDDKPEVHQEVRRTKKKFNLTSTSSTLEKFSDKMNITIGRRPLRLKKVEKENEEKREQMGETRTEAMHRS